MLWIREITKMCCWHCLSEVKAVSYGRRIPRRVTIPGGRFLPYLAWTRKCRWTRHVFGLFVLNRVYNFMGVCPKSVVLHKGGIMIFFFALNSVRILKPHPYTQTRVKCPPPPSPRGDNCLYSYSIHERKCLILVPCLVHHHSYFVYSRYCINYIINMT